MYDELRNSRNVLLQLFLMNISNYVYDPCQEICKIVTDVHSMLIAKSDQEIARQNDSVSREAFVCYYATKILSNYSCLFPPNFTIHDFRYFTSRSKICQTFQVYPRLSLICQRILHQKEVQKGKVMCEKANYKKRHTTYNKKRNF